MAMRRTHNVCLTTGDYEKDGQQKKKRVNIGVMLTDDESGNMSLCLEVPPTFKPNKDGYPEAWLSLFPIERNNQQQPAYGSQQHAQQQAPQPMQPVPPQHMQPVPPQPAQIQQPPMPQGQPQPVANGDDIQF